MPAWEGAIHWPRSHTGHTLAGQWSWWADKGAEGGRGQGEGGRGWSGGQAAEMGLAEAVGPDSSSELEGDIAAVAVRVAFLVSIRARVSVSVWLKERGKGEGKGG